MNLSEKENCDDADYLHLKTLSFAYRPCYTGQPATNIFGIVIELKGKQLHEKKLLACYDSGFSACFSSHQKANINGKEFPQLGGVHKLEAFEHFISVTNEMYPDPRITRRSKALLKSSAQYLPLTTCDNTIYQSREIKFWFLTHSGVLCGGANNFEIQNKSSVWTKFHKEAVSLYKDLEMFRNGENILAKAASF